MVWGFVWGEGGSSAPMKDNSSQSFMTGNGSPAAQLLGCQTMHHGEAGNISETCQAQRWHTSPRCKVTGVPLCCSSLTCTCWALKAPDLIHRVWKVCPISSALLTWSSYSCSLWPGCPAAYAYQVCSTTRRDLNKAFKYLASMFFNEDMLWTKQSYFQLCCLPEKCTNFQ